MALFSRTSRVIGMVGLVVAASCAPAWAQPPGPDPAFEGLRAKLKTGDRVTLDLQNGSTVQGRVLDVAPDALSIAMAGGDRKVTPSDVVQIQRHRHGVLLGAIIGGGVGLVFGVGVGTILANEGHDRDGAVFGLTALGLGAGIAIDAVANIPRTVYRRGRTRTAVNIQADPRRAAVRVVVAF